MGKNNRQRRAEKLRRRAHQAQVRANAHDPRRVETPFAAPLDDVEDLVRMAISARGSADEHHAEAIQTLLAHRPSGLVAQVIETKFAHLVHHAWDNGWQPAELARHVRRNATPAAELIALYAIAVDNDARAPKSLDPRWIRQLDALELPRTIATTNWIRPWAERRASAWPDAIRHAISALQALADATRLPTIIPPPGHPDNGKIDLTSPVDDPILQRVRALLAQAESTTFDAEAETFTAKAQELMTRHSIDVALLDARRSLANEPITLRIPIDDPYADAKASLAHVVAVNSRCRAVYQPDFALTSIIGMPADVAGSEMLFTSLLVQGSTSMHSASAGAESGARTRSRGFRSSFWSGYANRVGQRLREINEQIVHDADIESDGTLLPVLASRSARVDSAVERMFANLTTSKRRSVSDGAGWAMGTAAAEAAQLNRGTLATQ